MLTDFEFYYWTTENEHATNEVTLNDFLDNHLTDDYDILRVDGTYAEIAERDGFVWAVHASGAGDFKNHKVQFDAIGFRS